MLVSVVMAVFNGEDYLNEAVESVLRQTYPHFEFIIVNDGSTDHTKDILDSYRDQRVKIIHLEKNQGAAASLNIAVEQSAGQWIAVHDADDVSEPVRLEEQVNYLAARPDIIGVGSFIRTIPGKSSVLTPKKMAEEKYYNQILTRDAVYGRRLFLCYLCHGTTMYSKEAFYMAGRYNPEYEISYDYHLWLRMFDIAPLEKIPKVLYNYRVHKGSLGKQNVRNTIAELMTISFTYVYKYLSKNLKRKPIMAVIGSKKGCDFFKKHVRTKKHSGKYKFYNTALKKELKKVHSLFQKGNIDAILLLHQKNSRQVIKYLRKQGMKWNVNLFLIWNYRY